MKSSVDKLNDTRVKINVEVPFDELTPEFDRAYAALANQVQIPGFRKGKAPRQLIEARVGRGPVLEQVINEMLPNYYGKAVEEHELKVVAQPNVEVTKVEDGKVVEFTAEVDVRPEFEAPKFEDITVEVAPATVDDEAVENELKNLQQRFGTLKVVERKAKKGDVVEVNVRAEADGEEVEEAAYNGLVVELGKDDFIEGMSDAIEGLKAGEEGNFDTTINHGEHKGEKGTFFVTVTSVKERELPELNDEFAEMSSEFDTLEELKADLTEQVTERAKTAQAMAIRDEVLKKALEAVEFPLPESLIQEQVDGQLQQLLSQFNGDEKFLDAMLQAQGMNREEFDAKARESAEEAVRTQLLLDAVAEVEKPEVSQEDFVEHVMFTARNYGMEPQQFMNAIQESGQMGTLFADLRRGKALAAAICKVTAKDTDGNDIDVAEYYGPETPEAETENEAE